MVRGNKTLKFFLFLFILVICILLGRYYQFDFEPCREYLLKFPVVLSGLIYVFLYVGITTFVWFGPKDVFRIMGAVVFGPLISTVFVWIAETFNAAILFLLSRKLGRDFVVQKFKIKSADIEKANETRGSIGVFSLRINPLIPFRIMDLGFGLSKISLKRYIVIVFIASLPRIFWLQYILSEVGANIFKDIPAVMAYFEANPFVLHYSALYFLVVIGLTVFAVVVKFVNKKAIPL